MIATLGEATAHLTAEGMEVTQTQHPPGLQIAGSWRDSDGIRVSNDSCVLGLRDNQWVAGFRAEGLLGQEVPGTLNDLVNLIISIYRRYRQFGGKFSDAVEQTIPNAHHNQTERITQKTLGQIETDEIAV